MRYIASFSLVLLGTASMVFAVASRKSDAEIHRMLVGTWGSPAIQSDKPYSSATYNSNGTGIELVHFPEDASDRFVRVDTSWSVSDGILIVRSTASSDPSRIPAGVELKDRIVSITETSYTFEPVDGYDGKAAARETRIRKKPA